MSQIDANCRLYCPREFNARSKQRFFRHRRVELIEHVGGAPSRTQLVLIERIARNEWDLRRLDARMDEADLSNHDMRMRLAMENRLRLDLRDLGLKGAAPATPSLAEHLARRAAEKAAGEVEGAAA
jgi:hypothetical protein